jgi:hypothetical protein
LCAAEMTRMDSKAAFFGMKSVLVRLGQRRDLWSTPMALRSFVSQLSVVTAYLAFAFVGAIVLGVF